MSQFSRKRPDTLSLRALTSATNSLANASAPAGTGWVKSVAPNPDDAVKNEERSLIAREHVCLGRRLSIRAHVRASAACQSSRQVCPRARRNLCRFRRPSHKARNQRCVCDRRGERMRVGERDSRAAVPSAAKVGVGMAVGHNCREMYAFAWMEVRQFRIPVRFIIRHQCGIV